MSASPYAGISILDNFIPNNQNLLDGIRGQIPGPPIAAAPTWTIRADGTWGPASASGSLVPVIRFTGSVAGGVGQVFTDISLRRYTAAEDIQLFIGRTTKLLGGTLGTSDFTLNGNQITVNFNLPASSALFIDSKFLIDQVDTYYILTQMGSRITTEAGDLLIQQAGVAFQALWQRLQDLKEE